MRRAKHLAGWGNATFVCMACVCLALFITGLVMYFLPVTDLLDMTPLQAGLRHTSGVMHGVATWLFCLLCGRGVWPHVRVMWHKPHSSQAWLFGLSNLMLFIALALSGLALLYAGPQLHEASAPVHFWIGALSPLVFLAHTWRRFIPSKFELYR